jgi:hypothetical protein
MTSTAAREERAARIPIEQIVKDGDSYLVPSSDGRKKYRVTAISCTCKDHERTGNSCKHMLCIERMCPPSRFVGDPFEGF